jgi:hypothetical protein
VRRMREAARGLKRDIGLLVIFMMIGGLAA